MAHSEDMWTITVTIFCRGLNRYFAVYDVERRLVYSAVAECC